MCCVKTGCHARRQFGGISRRLRRLENVQMKIGARHAEHPVVKADVLRRYFENMRGELPALLDDRESGFVEGAAGDSEGARASCQSRRRTIGVAHDDIYPVGIDAELLRYELLIRGEKTSAVFLVAHYELDPIVLELDRGGLRKSAATALGICRHADAAQFAVTLALRAPPREGRPFRRGHAAVHHLFKLTRIEKKFCRRSVRHCRGRHEINAPNAVGAHAEVACGRIDQTLEQICGLGATGTTIGADRHGIGTYAFNIDVDGPDRIEPRDKIGRASRNERANGDR